MAVQQSRTVKSGDRVIVYSTPDNPLSDLNAITPDKAVNVSGQGYHGKVWTQAGDGRLEVPESWFIGVLPANITAALKENAPLLVFDVDSTLIEEEVIELLAAHAGKEAEVAEVTARAMRGELDFEESLHHRVATLKGLPLSVIDQVSAAVTVQAGARELIHAVNEVGGHSYAVSGGFNQVLAQHATELGLTDYTANTLGVSDGVLTGTVEGSVVDRAMKAQKLLQWQTQHGTPSEAVFAMGDGANDIDMLNKAGFGIAFNPKPALREHADLVLEIPNMHILLDLLP